MSRQYLKIKQVAARLETTVPTIYKMVAMKRLPAPVYIAPRAPRWASDELDAALEATRMLPAEAKAARAKIGAGRKSASKCENSLSPAKLR